MDENIVASLFGLLEGRAVAVQRLYYNLHFTERRIVAVNYGYYKFLRSRTDPEEFTASEYRSPDELLNLDPKNNYEIPYELLRSLKFRALDWIYGLYSGKCSVTIEYGDQKKHFAVSERQYILAKQGLLSRVENISGKVKFSKM